VTRFPPVRLNLRSKSSDAGTRPVRPALGGLAIGGTTGEAGQSGADPNNLILAIAAAVIGGTSLFGGRGRVWSALLGVLVIESINSGLYLLELTLDIQYMITEGVLLAAVVDSLSRRIQKSSGRA
jgi:D-xylose transport system permease protein